MKDTVKESKSGGYQTGVKVKLRPSYARSRVIEKVTDVLWDLDGEKPKDAYLRVAAFHVRASDAHEWSDLRSVCAQFVKVT